MSRRCVQCGAEQVEGHHLTGRDSQGCYLDRALTLWLCHDHHELAHDDWRTLRIQDPNPDHVECDAAPLSCVERVELRLRRLATLAGRMAAMLPQWTWLAELAKSFKRWADELARDIEARSRRDPDWRSDAAFFPSIV